MRGSWAASLLALCLGAAHAQDLRAARLAVIYKLGDASSETIAAEYAHRRGVPSENVVGVRLPDTSMIEPARFAPLRRQIIEELPANVQSLALVWTRPFAVGCMSITTAFAAGYQPGFCEPGCANTTESPLFNAAYWLPADTVGWWPAMLLPSDDVALARALIARGIAADDSHPPGILYLISTADRARNVRAAGYAGIELALGPRLRVAALTTPIERELPDAIGYFTGAKQVEEIGRVHFRPGALADHLTSSGGYLVGGRQMSALAWLQQGATASYGTVSEPCNGLGKFPDIAVLFAHYLRGESAIEAYWKSVRMPGQGLIVGEPLSRPFAAR